ncbi:class I SAM-dependent methyltransferase [Dankookia sp. GCM10030260]|uniref:class I SAM-dependent methyltransferase n=1 Tax=Dankookia sp. GCM10030260 TaxID=3273390 RepID=UPI00361D89CF
MAQNIYDDPTFFAGYSRLRRSVEGLDGAPEWPALRAMLPPLQGLRVVDLGCGFGWACRWMRQAGAATVLGLDLSESMLARARAMTGDPDVTYRRADLEDLDLPAAGFDLAFSALALHYIEDLPRLLGRLRRALVPGGHLVASLEHPILTAPSRQGWSIDAAGHRIWPLDGYQREGARVTDWLAKGVVKQHRMLGTTLNALLGAGFALTRVEEWAPTEAQIAEQPDLAPERERPMFLLLAARAA